MPILINDVVAEVEPAVVPGRDAQPSPLRAAVAEDQFELMAALALVEERKTRLMAD